MAEIKIGKRPQNLVRKESPPERGDVVAPGAQAGKGHMIQLRRFARYVRYTCSLLSPSGKIREELGHRWEANFKDRIIYWTPTTLFPPFRDLTTDEVLFGCGHECAHLDFTGGYEVPDDWDHNKRSCFHKFYNAVEDIRVDRLQGVAFPGYEEIRKPVGRVFRNLEPAGDKIPWEEAPAWYQVGLIWLGFENESKRLLGSDGCVQFAQDTWPDVSKMCNASSSDELVQAVIPIFEKLWEEQEQEEQEQPGGGAPQGGFGQKLKEEDADGDRPGEKFKGSGDPFGDEPSKYPSKSPFNEEQLPESPEQILIKIPMTPALKLALKRMTEEIRVKQNQNGNLIFLMEGTQAGTERGEQPPPDSSWVNSKAEMLPQIKALGQRLKYALKTNAADNWQDGMRRGRLNVKRASRAVAGDNRIFRQRKQIGARDYTFGIIADRSSSMSHGTKLGGVSKCKATLDASVLLGESFDKAGMPWFMIAWDTSLKTVKPIEQRISRLRDWLGSDVAHPSGGTYEAPALMAAQEEFLKAPSGHRVLFVLSDGETDRPEESQMIAAELEDMGVKVIAIGIGIPAPKHHRIQVRVDDATELVHLLPKLVNEVVRKGGK